MSRKFTWFIIGSICLAVLASVPSAWGVLNNGFETDYVYLIRWSGDFAPIRRHQEIDGVEVGDRWQEDNTWKTLTFSGGATTSDARLFVAKDSGTDIIIGELDSTGNVINSANLSTIIGESPNRSVMEYMRYNRFHDSLIVGAKTTAGVARAWEVNLALNQHLHTYVGSTIPDGRSANVAIDERTGDLYMVSRNLGEGSTTSKGDLIKFVTAGRVVGGTMVAYSVVIDGPTKQGAPDPQDADWHDPGSALYRDSRPVMYNGTNPLYDDTVLVTRGGVTSPYPVLESWVNTIAHPVDSENNLSLRGKPCATSNTCAGQQDDVSGAVWFANYRGGWTVLYSDDTSYTWNYTGDANGWSYCDIDSPPYGGDLPPVIGAVTPNPDWVPSGVPYVKQLRLDQGRTRPATWSLLQGPAGAYIDTSEIGKVTVKGWTPGNDDLGIEFTFEAEVTTDQGTDTEVWLVNVLASNNGFIADYVYVARDPAQGGQIRVFREADGVIMIDTFLPDGSNWVSLTFAGEGRNNDARLFMAKPSGTDIQIDEFDYQATQVRSVLLSALVPGWSCTSLTFGDIRYSKFYPDSLFIAASSTSGDGSKGRVWEVNLGLTALKNTYTGPTMPAEGDGTIRQANIAIDEDNGTIYMTGRHLNSDTADSLGDLVKVNPTGTNPPFEVLVNGETMQGTEPSWSGPHTVIFRNGDPNRGDGTDTLLVGMAPPGTGTSGAVIELYLDINLHPVDINNNLQVRPGSLVLQRPWNGQEDAASGTVWIAAIRGGYHGLEADDTLVSWWLNRNLVDIDSPPFNPCNDPFADIDGDTDVDQDDFAVFQVCYTGDVFGGSPPVGNCRCFDVDGNEKIDSFDFTAFQLCASGPGIAADPSCDD